MARITADPTQFGGPIRRDKTFFYAVYEALNSAQGGATTGAPVIDTVPAIGCLGGANRVVWNGTGTQPAGSIGPCNQLGSNPAGAGTNSVTINPIMALLLALYPQTGPNLPNNQYTFSTNTTVNESFGQIRIDHTISNKDSLFARYTIDNGVSDIPQSFPQFKQSNPGANQYLTVGETHLFSSSVVNAFRLSGSRTSQNVFNLLIGGTYTGAQYSFVPGLLLGSLGSFSGITGLGPSTSAQRYLYQDVFTTLDDISVNRGKHTLKYGALLNLFRTAVASNIKASGVLTFGERYVNRRLGQAFCR